MFRYIMCGDQLHPLITPLDGTDLTTSKFSGKKFLDEAKRKQVPRRKVKRKGKAK